MEEYTPVFASQKAISYAIEVENVKSCRHLHPILKANVTV